MKWSSLQRRVSIFTPKCLDVIGSSSLYYKPMTIVDDNSRVVNKLEASLTDNAKVIIYGCHMFIVQATGLVNLFINVKLMKCSGTKMLIHSNN
jgi:hypothetical protein